MKKHFWIYVLILSVLSMTGCQFSSLSQKPEAPLHDSVLSYDLPMDLAFLRTMEALEKIPDWTLEATEKEKGWIRIRNVNYSRFDDASKRLITVRVTPKGRDKVSIQLSEESQRVLGGDTVLTAIDDVLKKASEERAARMSANQPAA